MLRILSKNDFKGLQVHTTLPDISEEFEDVFDNGLFKLGLWLEYWENPVINFKFHVFENVVTIYSGNFSSQFSKEDLETFFRGTVHLGDLYEWVKTDINIEIKDKQSKESDQITEIWKYDTKIFYGYWNKIMTETDVLFKNYYEFLLQNTKIVRSLPYTWGQGLLLRCMDPQNTDDKIYWTNLCALKLYVTRKYNGSN